MELFKSRPRVVYTNAVGDKVYPVVVDIKKGIKSTEDIQFVSSDVNTGILSVAFIQGNDNYNVTGADVVCSVMRPDASTLELPCEVVGENIVEVPLGINGTSQDGVYSFDFKVFKGENKVVGTPIMSYSVSLSIDNDMVVEEDDRLPVLTVLMTQLTELKGEARESINQANTATVASREATAKAIEATNNANTVSERVSQETSEAISRVDNKVNEVETRFNALTSSQQQDAEVIDARDGETSLKARLDRDIEKAKQVYVELEGSYISTESSTGAIQDLEILGNTVQDPNNLADIKSVGELQEDGTYKMSILSCGKNLFDGELEQGTYSYDGSIKTSIDGEVRNVNPIYVKGGSTICFTSNTSVGILVWEYNSLGVCELKSPSEANMNVGFKLRENTKYINFRLGTNDENVVLQLEEGTVATSYEPYQGNKCDILLPCQLEKVGDVSDRLYYDDVEKAWCIEKKIGEDLFNGNENWRLYGGNSSNTFSINLDHSNSIANTCVISDKLPYNVNCWEDLDDNIGISRSNANGVIIRILKSNLDTVDVSGMKDWIKKNNIKMKYQLATPQKIVLPLSAQIQLNSFFGTTHVYMESGEVEGTIKCKIPKSLGATVQSLNNKTDILSDRIEAIEGLKDSQNMKYETDKGYLVCKETKNGVIDDLKIEGKTLATVLTCSTNKNYAKWAPVDCVSYKAVEVGKVYTIIAQTNNTAQCGLKNRTSNDYLLALAAAEEFICKAITFSKAEELVIITDTEGTVNMELMILEGDHTQNPPSYFEGLMSVGQDVDKIEVLSCNKNLFDKNNIKPKGWYSSTTGDLTSSNDNYITIKPIFVKPNTYYIANEGFSYCWQYDANMKFVKFTNTEPFLTNENTKYIHLGKSYASSSGEYTFGNLQLNEGKELKPYTPHQSDKKQILFYNENGELEPIAELHEWDSIEKHSDNKWYYHKRSGKVVLNGSENWRVDIGVSFQVDTICFTYDDKTLLDTGVLNCTSIVDKFKVDGFNVTFNMKDCESYSTGWQQHFIKIQRSKLSTQDVQGFKQWLQANNVTAVYQLAQEEVYELAPLHLDSYANETLILCNSGAISPKMEFSITSHINELVKSQGDRISLLEEKMYKALKQVLAGDMYSLAELLYPEDFVEENPENEIMLLPFE